MQIKNSVGYATAPIKRSVSAFAVTEFKEILAQKVLKIPAISCSIFFQHKPTNDYFA